MGDRSEVTAMGLDTSAAMLERRAIRKYKPDQIPDEILKEILIEARWAPSATNTQSTNVYVVSGEPLERFKAELRQYAESEVEPKPDFPPGAGLPPALMARQQALFQTRMSFIAAEEAKLGIRPTDPPVSPMVAGAAIFGARTLLVLAFQRGVSDAYGCFDAGLLAMAVCLAAQARGLGTCIAGGIARHADLLHKLLPGTDEQKILITIAIGYPDFDVPINRFPRTRIPVDEFVTFVR
jgi:nitroreductase